MTPFSQLQKGIANYLDNEVMPAFREEGWKRVAAGAAVALAIQRSEKFLPMIQNNSFAKTMELVDDKGDLDIEALIPVVKSQLQTEPMTIDVPMLGKLTFRESDVDKLYDYIRTAR